MNSLALQAAGILAILSAVGHGVLGDRMLKNQPIEPQHIKNFIRFCYQFGSVGWLAGGVILLLISAEVVEAQQWLVYVLASIYGFGAAVNAWFTRGKHFGWVMLLAVVVLAIVGIF